MRKLAAGLAGAAMGLAMAGAQTTPPRDARATAALTQAIGAMGAGNAALLTDSVTVAEVGKPGALDTTSTVTTLGSSQMRVDTTGPGGASSRVLRNGAALDLAPAGAKAAGTWRAEPPGNASHERLLHLPGPMLVWELARGDVGADWVGAETLNGAAVVHLRLRRVVTQGTGHDELLTGNSELEIYLDANDNTVRRIGWKQVSAIDIRLTQPMTVDYDDYRPVATPAGTVLLPFHAVTAFAGHASGEARVTSYSFNTGVSPSLFAVRTAGGGGQ